MCRDENLSARSRGMSGTTVSIYMSITLLAWKRWPLQTVLSTRGGHMFHWLKPGSMREKHVTVYTKASYQVTANASLYCKKRWEVDDHLTGLNKIPVPSLWWAHKSSVSSAWLWHAFTLRIHLYFPHTPVQLHLSWGDCLFGVQGFNHCSASDFLLWYFLLSCAQHLAPGLAFLTLSTSSGVSVLLLIHSPTLPPLLCLLRFISAPLPLPQKHLCFIAAVPFVLIGVLPAPYDGRHWSTVCQRKQTNW